MLFGLDVNSFFENIRYDYEMLPNEAKLIVYIILILLFIAVILSVILLEQRRISKKMSLKNYNINDIMIDDFDLEPTAIDETNEKTRNLKEITDKIQAVLDNKNIDLTRFEQDQEEQSIISYDELVKKAGRPKEIPDEEFSLSKLVRKIEVDEEIEATEPFSIPARQEVKEEGKFKSSVFISPVFGSQQEQNLNSSPKPVEIVSNVVPQNNYERTKVIEEETFLNNLINFRKNLE